MESASCFFSATEWSPALVIDPVWYKGRGGAREGGPKCCQFAALIFQPWPVRLEGRRRGPPQSSLRGTTLYLTLLCLLHVAVYQCSLENKSLSVRLNYDSTDSSTRSQPPADDIFVFLCLFFRRSKIAFWWLCDLCLFVWVFVPSHGVQYV